MKKMMIVLMMVFTMMTGVFAYEPKKENAKVKRNGDVIYYEKTALYDTLGGKPDPKARGWDGRKTTLDYDKWVIRKGYTVEQCVNYNYDLLEHFRRGYVYNMQLVDNPKVEGFHKTIVDALNEINGTSETYEEHVVNNAQERAWYEKRTAVLSIPCVTEDNFLTLTKEEMLARMLDFIEEVKAENK